MPPSEQSPRLHLEPSRRVARHSFAKHSPQLAARGDSSSDSHIPASLPPSGARALIGIVVMLSVIVLGFTAWRIYVFRTSKKRNRDTQHAGLFDAVDEQTTKRSLSNASNLTPPMAAMTRERNPAEFRMNLGYEPKVIYIAPQQNPPQPKERVPPKVSNLAIVPPAGPPPYDQSAPKTPISPRTIASIAPRLPPAKSNRLPRLVIVESVFSPSLHDELEIHVGETLRLLEEYEDEWCLVQRIGLKYAEKGVIPRFCITDKPGLPAVHGAKHVPQLSSSENVL